MGGGAWPFLVGGVICLVNSVTERDRCLLNGWSVLTLIAALLRGTWIIKIQEDSGNNRSVMPLDVLGRTRVALTHSTSLQPWPRGLGNLVDVHRDGDRSLKLLILNEEFLVNTDHQSALITSLPLHTPPVAPTDWMVR